MQNISFPCVKTRNSFLAHIDPFLNYYGKNDKVKEILDQAVSDLEDLLIRPNQGMPPTIAQAGRSFSHPAMLAACIPGRSGKAIRDRYSILPKMALFLPINQKNKSFYLLLIIIIYMFYRILKKSCK